MCGICVADTSVHSSIAGTPTRCSPAARSRSGSGGAGSTAPATMTGAVSNTVWSPAPPWLQCTVTFVPRSSWRSTSSVGGLLDVRHRGELASPDRDGFGGVHACSRVSATTTATASPANRSCPRERVVHRDLDVLGDRPDERQGAEPRSSAVYTPTTPGIAAATDVSIAVDPRVDVGRPDDRHPHHPGHRPVVDEAACPVRSSGSSFRRTGWPMNVSVVAIAAPSGLGAAHRPAASRIDFTMFW